jgi:very-short-patch-repair endonuclease
LLGFRREYPIPPYTVDFCCVERKLIIEVDGETHFTDEGLARDENRDRFLASQGYKILRIPGYAVIGEDGNPLQTIKEFVATVIAEQSPSPPAPLPFVPQGRGEPKDLPECSEASPDGNS